MYMYIIECLHIVVIPSFYRITLLRERGCTQFPNAFKRLIRARTHKSCINTVKINYTTSGLTTRTIAYDLVIVYVAIIFVIIMRCLDFCSPRNYSLHFTTRITAPFDTFVWAILPRRIALEALIWDITLAVWPPLLNNVEGKIVL